MKENKPKTAKQKAIELVDYYKGIVYPYSGSSMLTNTAYGPTILENCKICAKKVVEEIHEEWEDRSDDYTNDCRKFWCDVLGEIDNVTCKDIDISEGYI
ncbi:MAG TPA: hypothetical protein VGF79_00970 [Bacteroidia bacterium]